MSRVPRVVCALLLSTLVYAGCGGDDDSSAAPPLILAVTDESGDGVALIGEDVTLVGVTDDSVTARIDGTEAPHQGLSADGLVVRVPPNVGTGSIPVVVSNAAGSSPEVEIQIRRLAYTADFSNRTLSVLSVDGLAVSQRGEIAVDVAPGPFAVAFTPDGRTAVVPCGVGFLPDSIVAALAPGAPPGDSVAIIDVIRGVTVAVIRTGEDSIPTGVAIHPDGRSAYVTNYGTSTVSVIDIEERSVRATIDVPRQPEEVAVRPDGAILLVNSVSGSVSTIDTATLEILATVETGGNDPSGVAWSDDGQTAYVANSFTNPNLGDDGTLTIIDTTDPTMPVVIDTLSDAIGPTPYDVDLVPGRSLAVVTNLNVIFDPVSIGPGSVALVDLSVSPAAVTTLPVGLSPIRAALGVNGQVALVGNGLDQTVTVIDLDSGSVFATVELQSAVGPADVAIQP